MIIASRLILALLLGVMGYQIGQSADVVRALPDVDRTVRLGALVAVGAITGFLIGGVAGKLVQRGISRVNDSLRRRSGAELVVGAAGLLVGLAVAGLLSLPIRNLEFVGRYLLLPMTLIIAYVFAEIAADKHAEILKLIGVRVDRADARSKLLDTSVLIDGRIADIVATGFVEGDLVVPVFVLEELQNIADSSDELRRARGRRGLDVIHQLRKARLLRTPEEDYPDVPAVDSKLVRMARENDFSIVTTDFNLNKVAQIQQVTVLNVNELANALKPEFVPGERFTLKVVREGKEPDQGVGYLDDGTMVIVDKGKRVLGKQAEVVVTSVLQSPTGKLVFSRLADAASPGAAKAR